MLLIANKLVFYELANNSLFNFNNTNTRLFISKSKSMQMKKVFIRKYIFYNLYTFLHILFTFISIFYYNYGFSENTSENGKLLIIIINQIVCTKNNS